VIGYLSGVNEALHARNRYGPSYEGVDPRGANVTLPDRNYRTYPRQIEQYRGQIWEPLNPTRKGIKENSTGINAVRDSRDRFALRSNAATLPISGKTD
jgi:hypothetical protein